MNLLIDIGNTRLKSAISNGKTLDYWRSHAWREQALEEVFTELWSDLKPHRVVVSNVAGDAMEQALESWVRAYWKIVPEFARTSPQVGDLVCAYSNPEQLGIDRWVAVQAAVSLYDSAVIVVDCGTATTIDLITADRKHRGGAILPGIRTMRRALAGGTANLDVPDGDVTAFANNTRDAIAGGTVYAVCGAIDRLVAEAKQEFAETPEVLITGGEAEMVRTLLATPTKLYPDLVLQGLEVIAKRKF